MQVTWLTVKRGVLYVAIGDQFYLLFTTCSILSLRHNGYSGPISVITDLDEGKSLEKIGINVIFVKVPVNAKRPSRWVKTQLYMLSPYDETLSLDADIIALQPIEKIWGFLSDTPALAIDCILPILGQVVHGQMDEWRYTINECDSNFPHFNTGVILWKKSKEAHQVFSEWHREWLRFRDIDQLAFLRALNNTYTRPSYLPIHFNYSFTRAKDFKADLRSGAVLLHFHGMKSSIVNLFPDTYKQAREITEIYVKFPLLKEKISSILYQLHILKCKTMKLLS